MMNKNLGYIHFWITAVGAYGVFFPMHFIGMAGLPRRYYTNTAFPYFDDIADINIVISIFAFITGAAQIIFLYNFIHSIYYGKSTVQNPWKSTTLILQLLHGLLNSDNRRLSALNLNMNSHVGSNLVLLGYTGIFQI